MTKTRLIVLVLLLLATCCRVDAAGPKIPMLYSTDLFHPHGDPDDHYDLATLFAIDAFDIKGVILDLGATQKTRIGRPPVEQMMKITGRNVPYAVGLSQRFRSRTDKALEEPAEFQGAVNLIISVLRDSEEKVVITTTGSCRDVAAAFNREPDLLKEKVRAVYINIGVVPNEERRECNVTYDPLAYYRMFESGLPLYWCPCIGKGDYKTGYSVDHATVIGACSPPVQNYFVYCLTKSEADPIEFLATGPHPVPTFHVASWDPKPSSKKGMWCTGPMFHAAGWKIYQRGTDDFVALPPAEAEKVGLADKVVEAFDFEPIRVTIESTTPRPVVELKEPAAGKLVASFLGERSDRVGKSGLDPDGYPDCQVRLLGTKPDKPIDNLVLTGPRTGHWEHVATGRWWRVAYERDGNRLDAYFRFYADGEHKIQVLYKDGTSQTATFEVQRVAPVRLRGELDSAEPNCHVFRATDDRYRQILASCLKDLLAGLGDAPRPK